MDQSSNHLKYNVFQIPRLQSGESEQTLIGIHDASGSMSSVWKYNARAWNQIIENQQHVFTITFSNEAHLHQPNILSENIHDHFCGGTNICSAFHELERLFTSGEIKTKFVSIVFVSDGEDSQSGVETRLKNLTAGLSTHAMNYQISFLCLGVGTGFPTFLAMNLRSILHSGNQEIPSLFLVLQEGGYETNFKEQYASLNAYVTQSEKLEIQPSYPKHVWDQKTLTNVAYGGQFILTEQNIDSLKVGAQVIFPLNVVDKDVILKLGRAWLQELQISSIQQNVGPQAKEAHAVFSYLVSWYNIKIQGIESQNKKSVMQRIIDRQKHAENHDLQEILHNLKVIGESEQLSKLTPEEAAKRLAIGTKVGKYHNIAIKFCGISVDDYRGIRDEAIVIAKAMTVNYNESDQTQSIISLQNFKDILAEPDLLLALENCSSQFDLVNVLPLVGEGLFIKRFDGGLVNPWLVEVASMARLHSTVDTISIYSKADKQLELKIGQDEIEKINVVLPLFGEKDLDLAPFLRTRLFNILMTFNLLQNVDCCFDTSHAALSANTLLYLVNQPPSQWKDRYLELLHITFVYKYSDEEDFNKMKETMLGNKPELALVNDHPSLEHRCEDPSKAIIMLFDLVRTRNTKIQPNLQRIVDAIVCEAIGRFVPQDFKLFNCFDYDEVPFSEDKLNQLVDSIVLQLGDAVFAVRTELRTTITKIVQQLDISGGVQIQMEFNPQKLTFLKGKYTVQNLQSIYKFFLGKEFTNQELACLVAHAVANRNSFSRNSTTAPKDYAKVLERANKLILDSLYPQSTIIQKAFDASKNTHFKVLPGDNPHLYIEPLTRQQLLERLHMDEDSLKQLGYNPKTNLCRYACMAPGCPQYLIYDPEHRAHYNIHLPFSYKFFRFVRAMRDLDSSEILTTLQQSPNKKIKKFIIDSYEEAEQLVDNLSSIYNGIHGPK